MQRALNMHHERMRAAEHAPRGPLHLLQCFHGLAKIVERGAKQFRRVLVTMMLAGRDRYSYVLMTRWDITYVDTPPRCLLAGAASYSARSLRAPFANQDFLQLVAGRHVCRWVCAVARRRPRIAPMASTRHER